MNMLKIVERGVERWVPMEDGPQLPATQGSVTQMSEAESNALQSLATQQMRPAVIQMAELPQPTQSGHTRENFTLREMGDVITRYTQQDMIVYGVGVAALLLLIWHFVDAPFVIYFGGYLVVMTIVYLFAQYKNRGQGWDNSPAGQARSAQSATVRMHERAMATEDNRIAAETERYKMEIELRRELGTRLLQRIEGKQND